MSHLTPEGKNIEVTGDKVRALQVHDSIAVCSPQIDPSAAQLARTPSGRETGCRDRKETYVSRLNAVFSSDLSSDPGLIFMDLHSALAQRGADFIREQAARLPLDLTSDADPARDKALADSVRGGFVDDVGVEENRRIFNVSAGGETKEKTE